MRYYLRKICFSLFMVVVLFVCQTSWAQTNEVTASSQQLLQRLEDTEQRLKEAERRLTQTELELRQTRFEKHSSATEFQPANTHANFESDVAASACQSCEPLDSCSDSCNDSFAGLAWQKPDGWTVTPFGKLEAETILTNDATVSQNYIVFAVPQEAIRTDQIDITGQSTQVGLDIAGPKFGNFQVGGLILLDFHGNRPSRNEPGAYFIRGYGELVNERWRIAFGQMGDTIEGWNAEVVNWQGLGGLGYLGANQRGTFRVDRFIKPDENTDWTITGALTQPVVTDLAGLQDTFGQDNGIPNFEGKIVWGKGQMREEERALQFSLAGLWGQTNALARSLPGFPIGVQNVSNAYAIALASQYRGERFGARGQIWNGRGLGTYMGGVSQSLNLETGDTIEATGGFAQVWMNIGKRWRISGFGGIDNPVDSDLSTLAMDNQRSRNSVIGGNVTWFFNDRFHVRCDVMGVETDYAQSDTDNDIVAVLTEASLSY